MKQLWLPQYYFLSKAELKIFATVDYASEMVGIYLFLPPLIAAIVCIVIYLNSMLQQTQTLSLGAISFV